MQTVLVLAGALLLAFSGCSKSNTSSSAPAQAPALTQEHIAAEVARQVAEQLAVQKAALDGAAEPAADKPQVWEIGGAAPNGGLVYFAQDEEFYEAMAPANTVGINDSLPAGWLAPDMEDLGLMYAGLQKTGAADYGAVYYYSVSKAGGKNRFLRMSDGTEATDVTVGRKVGVRKFDPSQPPAPFDKAVLVYTPAQAEQAAVNTAAVPAPAATVAQAPEQTPAKPAPAAKVYAIGDTGPGGGIVFSNSGGKYKEITKPENAGNLHAPPPAGWRLPTMPELMQVYTALHATVNFGAGWYYSSSSITYRGGTDYSRDHASLPSGQTDYDRVRAMFPDVQFILAAGGASSVHLIRFTDGRIILAVQEDVLYYVDFSQPSGDRDYTSVNLDGITKCLYVRDF